MNQKRFERLLLPSASVIREMTTISASILSASMLIGNSGFGCGYSQQILPRQLVAQESPDAVQRHRAIDLLECWHQNSPMKGLIGQALDAIYQGDLIIPGGESS
jgi:hypothetical protein